MSEKSTIKIKRLADGTVLQILPDGSTRPVKGETDWARVNAMAEADIDAAAISDADNPLLTTDELNRFRAVPNLKNIRKTLHMTQEQFARSFALPLGTVRDWEQGAKQPDSAARILLHVIAKDPQAVLQALKN